MLCRVICVLLFVVWAGERPVEFDQQLYLGLWRSWLVVLGPLFVSIPGLSLWAWQVIAYALVPVAAFWPGAWRRRPSVLDAAMLVCLGSVAVAFVWGVARGGSAYNAYYQLWRFLMAPVIAFLVVASLRTARDVKAVGITLVVSALVRGNLGIYFYYAHVKDKVFPVPEFVITHDDSLLFVAAVLIVLIWAMLRGRASAFLGAALVTADLFYAMVLNDRRIAWVELMLGLGIVFLMAPRRWRRRIVRAMLLCAPLIAGYIVVGRTRPEAIFSPARSLATVGSDEDPSSLARQEEIRNLLYTLSDVGNPLFGTGWGVPYEKVSSVYANYGDEWWQYRYLPHNSLLGVAAFSGLAGIVGMWMIVPVTAFLSSRGYWNSTGIVERTGALASLCVLPAYSTHCYGDVGLQSLTCNVILGVAMGVGGKVSAWAESGRGAAGEAEPRMVPVVRPAPADDEWAAQVARTAARAARRR